MTPLARRLYPLAVLLSGIVAAAVAVPLGARARRAERAAADAHAVQLVAAAVGARTDGLARAVRGPALAFELGALSAEEATGLLRLAYAQSEGVAAVTLLDRNGTPVELRDRAGQTSRLPAVFLARPGAFGGAHPVESLDDLDRFSQNIPLAAALARGRATRGPYPSLRDGGARIAVAESVPVAEGTSTWVLAAEIDAAPLLEGLSGVTGDADVALVTSQMTVGSLARAPAEARAAIMARAARAASVRVPETLAGRTWRAAVVRAPGDLGGVVALAWSREDDWARRARSGELGVAVVIVTIVGALAAALAVSLREAPPEPSAAEREAADAAGYQARVLGAVVKELANPIAAATAAARLLTGDAAKGRVVEALQRSTLRVERAFRRVARLARAGQERARVEVDLGAIVAREIDASRAEVEQGGLRLECVRPGAARAVRGDPEDLAMLVQVLIEGARSVAPAGSTVTAVLRDASTGGGLELAVRDRGALRPAERRALLDVGEGTRTEGAASALSWAVAARIAADHRAQLEIRESHDESVETVVVFAGDA